LRREPLRDVPDDHVRGETALVHEWNGRDLDLDSGPIQPVECVPHDRRAAVIFDILEMGRIEEHGDRPPDQLIAVIGAGQARDGGVGHDDVLAVMNQDAVRRKLDQSLVAFLQIRIVGIADVRHPSPRRIARVYSPDHLIVHRADPVLTVMSVEKTTDWRYGVFVPWKR
jgi:hypothetical protein